MESKRKMSKTKLEKYLEFSRNGRMKEAEMKEYVQEQRFRIDDMNRIFWLAQNHGKPEPYDIFQIVKIEYVVSAREFYSIQIRDLEARSEFQNVLNQVYDDDCEPINQLKEKDLCIVNYDCGWYRAKVVEIAVKNGKSRITVLLVDYGRTVHTKQKHIGMLKMPHEGIIPFVNKCQLSLLYYDHEDVPSDAVAQEFTRVSKANSQVALYFRGMNSEMDTHDVTLFAECAAPNANTVYGAYLLHEAYSAFIRSTIRFDDETCEKWAQNIFKMCNDSMTNDKKKVQVHVSYIVSPTEIYVKCNAAEAFMGHIRKKIDKYIRQHENPATEEWAVGDDCLVRVQNWLTKTTLKPWYRGRIVGEYLNSGKFRVFLRDYGRTVEVSNIDLRLISPQLAAPSNAVQQCRLNISKFWTVSATITLRQIVHEYAYFAISCSSKDGACLSVTLWATNALPETKKLEIWDDIGLRVISQSVIESMQAFVKKSQRRYFRNKFRSKYNRYSDSDTSMCHSHEKFEDLSFDFDDKLDSTISDTNDANAKIPKWLPAIPIDRARIAGVVTHITNKGIIYVQEESNHDTAFEIEQQITRHVKKTNPEDFKGHEWHKGDTCFAWKKSISCEKGVYCRGVIEKINVENGMCWVNYVDHGKQKWFRLDDLYPATKFGAIPILVHRFYDSKFVAADKGGNWSTVVWQEFKHSLIKADAVVECDIRVDPIVDINQIRNEILPCSIEARILPADQYTMFKQKKFFFDVGYNANDEGILFV